MDFTAILEDGRPIADLIQPSDHDADDDLDEVDRLKDSSEQRIGWCSTGSRRRRTHSTITVDVIESWERLGEYQVPGPNHIVVPGLDVELQGEIFMRLYHILKDPRTGNVFFCGLVFLRNGQRQENFPRDFLAHDDEEMSTFLEMEANEVHLSYHILLDSPYSPLDQSLRLFPAKSYKRPRHIKITTSKFPYLNESYEGQDFPTTEYPGDVLICRWVTTKSWRTEKDRHNKATTHCWRSIARVTEKDCEPRFYVPDKTLRETFRESTTIGGSSWGLHFSEHTRRQYELQRIEEAKTLVSAIPISRDPIVILNEPMDCILNDPPAAPSHNYVEILDDDDDYEAQQGMADLSWERTSRSSNQMVMPDRQRYSLGDIFCGCGGTALAAVAADIHVRFAVDSNPTMCETYQLNNPAARVACTDARNFLFSPVYASYSKKIDILHFSFPCQPFSKPHTRPGKHDQANREQLGTLECYLEDCKPRIVTIEEADALGTFSKHAQDLQRLIRQLTLHCYSVEFRIINLANYGLCQKRIRLVIIASCPGQRHPGFPTQTHYGEDRPDALDLPRWVRPRDVLADIPPCWRHHDPSDDSLLIEGQELDADSMFPTLITKSANVLHPEGWRKMTVMEKCKIQGFPLSFEFPDNQRASQMEKQIGNAVPPKAFEVIFKHIIRELLRDDGRLDERSGGRKAKN